MKRELSIDIETYSDLKLKDVGAYRYVEHPSFEVLLFGYAFDNDPVELVDLANFEEIPQEVVDAVLNPDITNTAWNASFERICLAKHFGQPMPPENWSCTMVRSYYNGLPGQLGLVGKALKMNLEKDKEGKALIRYFCQPCKPTKKNGGRTRNYPHHDEEKWEAFKEYCKQDVRVERKARSMMQPLPKPEQILWCLDQHANDKGIRVEMTLVDKAVELYDSFTDRLREHAKKLTGLANPNSIPQMKGWLTKQLGLLEPSKSMDKAFVKDALEKGVPPIVEKVLKIRQELGKTSCKKFHLLQVATCDDGRIRGVIQFYGANRTGRDAGRLLQVQNLAKNMLEDLDGARRLIMKGLFDAFEMLYDDVLSTLSQLIRTTLIADEGYTWLVGDFSAIEARVIAWVADEEWRMEVFRTHGKIYEASASTMFKIPFDLITKGSKERQKGKVAELACIAEGSLVLTDQGLVPIESVTTDMRVWDGVDWVQHEGVIYKGVREVITYEGLTATEDHLVWVEGSQGAIPFGEASRSGQHLIQSGTGRQAIWVGEDPISGATISDGVDPTLCASGVPKLWRGEVDQLLQSDPRVDEGLSAVFPAETRSKEIGETPDVSETTLYEHQRQKLQELRSPRDRVPVRISASCGRVGAGTSRTTTKRDGFGSHRQQWPLRSGESALEYPIREQPQSAHIGDGVLGSERVALCADDRGAKINQRDDARRDYSGSGTGGAGETQELAQHSIKVRVYDILNAGPRNRFTCSDVLVHNCGYGGGKGALKAMDPKWAETQTDDELQEIIWAWRDASPSIVRLWRQMEDSAMQAIREQTSVAVKHGVSFHYRYGHLYLRFPSGRETCYRNAKIEKMEKFGRTSDTITFWGTEQGQWKKQDTYGGKLTENLIQGIARDCLMVAFKRLSDDGFDVRFRVHDELVANGLAKDEERMREIMGQPIKWAPGLPLPADTYTSDYYMKD